MKRRFLCIIAPAFIFLLLSQPSPAQIQYEVHFACDMEVQILLGNFNPSAPTDRVYVRGAFNGWGTDDEMFDPDNDSIYTATVFMNLVPAVDTMLYKYMYSSAATGDIWESGDNRGFSATGDETDINGNGIPDLIIPTRYFDDLGPDPPGGGVPVYFEADMRPAYAYLDSLGVIPFGGGNVTAIDSVFIAGEIPYTKPEFIWVWNHPPGDTLRTALKLNDAGMNGDLLAGDSVWTITIDFYWGAPVNIAWKFSINGFDNEAPPGQTHTQNLNQVPDLRVFRSCFRSLNFRH